MSDPPGTASAEPVDALVGDFGVAAGRARCFEELQVVVVVGHLRLSDGRLYSTTMSRVKPRKCPVCKTILNGKAALRLREQWRVQKAAYRAKKKDSK